MLGLAVPWIVLGLGLVGTAWAWRVLSDQEATYQASRLESALVQTRQAVEHRIEEQAKLLLGAQGLVAGRPRLGSRDWRAFVASLELGRYSPGTRLMGYFPRGPLEGLGGPPPMLETEGLLQPLGPRGERLLREGVFREALTRTRDQGTFVATGRLPVLGEGVPVVAFLLPVFRGFAVPVDVKTRRARFQGVVVSLVDASTVFRPMFGASPIAGLDVEIYQDSSCRAGGLLYDRDLCLAKNGVSLSREPWARRIPLQVGGQQWELVAGFVPEERASRDDRPRLVAVGGVLASLLAFALTLFLSQARRRSEALAHRLQESEARFRIVAETASCAIFIYSEAMEYMNAAGERMSGYSMADIQGHPFWELVHPLDQALVRDRAAARLRGEPVPLRYEFRLVTKQGETRWIDFAAGTMRLGGRTVGLGTAFDVTDRVEAHEARLQMERQLLETQRLESLGLLAGGVAHDFNNLLTVIQGNAGMLRDVQAEPDLAATCLRNIEETCLRASDLVRQMLAYSGRGKIHVQPASLNQVVQDITQLLAVSIPKAVDLRFELAPDLPPVEADMAQLQQVVMNLVTNAAEAIGERLGSIILRTGVKALDEREAAEVGVSEALKPGQFAYLEVEDTGEGMDPETLARIFDPFFTTKFTGRGLGLAAMQGIVRGHGGGVRILSKPGEGTLFRVYFPALAGVAEPSGPVPVPIAGDPWRGEGLVLVVDDEEGIRAFARLSLERTGFQVITAVDGLAGLEACRAHRGELRLVLLDLTMPKMGGEEALREMRTLCPTLPVVLWSGYGRRDHPGDPAIPFLSKPFRASELLEAVRAALA